MAKTDRTKKSTVRRPAARTPAPSAPTPSEVPDVLDDVETEAPEITGSHAVFDKHRAAAEALAPHEIVAYRADGHLAWHNAVRGRDAVLAVRSEIDATGFRVDWSAVAELTELAEAVVFANARIGGSAGSDGALRTLLAEARLLRALLLADARTRALVGSAALKGKVKAIERGRGPIDAAQDLVDLATLFAALKLSKGGSVTAEHVRRAAELGAELLRRLKPAGVKRASDRSDEQQQAAALRDRFWTLLIQRYEGLERAAGALWGRQLDAHVPALQSRYVAGKRAPRPVAPVG